MRICHDPFESARREWNGAGRDHLGRLVTGGDVPAPDRHAVLDVHQDRQGVEGFSWGGMILVPIQNQYFLSCGIITPTGVPHSIFDFYGKPVTPIKTVDVY